MPLSKIQLDSAADVIRDERSTLTNGPIDESMIKGHRADMWVGTGIHMPPYANGPKRPRHKPHRAHRRHKRLAVETRDEEEDKKRLLAPGQRVQFLLNQEDDTQSDYENKRIFTEMVELNGTDAQQEWRETARWVKFEEDVEEGGNRWSKPHVATLSLHSLFELRSCLLSGTVILDLEATDLTQVIDVLLEKLLAAKSIDECKREPIRESLLRKHVHQYEHAKPSASSKENAGGGSTFLSTVRSIADIGRQFSHARNLQQQDASPADAEGHAKLSKLCSVPPNPSGALISPALPTSLQLPKVGSVPKDISREPSALDSTKGNQHFFKKLPHGAEASNVMVGQLEFMDHHISAFIRLKQAVLLGDLTEVPVPTRFLFILLGPQGHGTQYREIGRAIATLMSDEVFHDVAYKAHSRNDLLDGVDEFLDQVTVLPPGEWDPNIRIEPPSSIPSQEKRKALPKSDKDEDQEEEEAGGHGLDPALRRTGRLFGGLIADVKRKIPFYISDYTDALNLQCLAAFMFMYFAMLAPIVTFGGLLEEATDKRMAAIENLLSGAICGTLYSLFSGQPLTMIGSTGPVLVFEKIIFTMTLNRWNYLAFRWWINFWSSIILLIIVATDASALVSYITRFTEENFSVLISFIFIYESIAKTMKILSTAHVIPFTEQLKPDPYCACRPNSLNASFGLDYLPNFNDPRDYSDVETMAHRRKWRGNLSLWITHQGNRTVVDFSRIPLSYCEASKVAVLDDPLHECYRMYDVFLMSAMLTLCTFGIAYTLKSMKTSCYFPNKVREILSDFAVIIALFVMVLVDYCVGLDTMKLYVPEKFEPTWSVGRGWVIDPFHGNPAYSAFVAIGPALLLCILLFMDHDITIVIVNRKENKLKKGCGYHLDLLLISIGVLISGLFGLPIFVAATVMSISHVNALKVESECRAPGEKPVFIGCREQRVTGLLVFIFIGLSVVMKDVLKVIPMPVLYGVFLYMGVSSLRGVQMIDRLLLLFIPMKYQPDYVYLRHVPINRVHLFTIIQVACFVILCVIKEIEITSIVFPVMLVVMVGVRKLMEYAFTDRELKYLDDPMPEITLRKKEDAKKKKEQLLKEKELDTVDQLAKLGTVKTEANLHIQLASGNVMKIPLSSIGEKSPDDSVCESPRAGGGDDAKIGDAAAVVAGRATKPSAAPTQLPQSMNISEEFNKSGVWRHIASEASLTSKDKVDTHVKKSLNGSSSTGSRKGNNGGGGGATRVAVKYVTPTAVPPPTSAKPSTSSSADDRVGEDCYDDDNDAITIKIERATPDPVSLMTSLSPSAANANGSTAAERQPLLRRGADDDDNKSVPSDERVSAV